MVFDCPEMLTPDALNVFRAKIRMFHSHELFTDERNRITGSYTEELLTKSILNTSAVSGPVVRMAAGAHAQDFDVVQHLDDGTERHWQFKSGKIQGRNDAARLVLSGPRMQGYLATHPADWSQSLTEYLNGIEYYTFSLSGAFHKNGRGSKHEYAIYHVHPDVFRCAADDWQPTIDKRGRAKADGSMQNTNPHGVQTRLQVSMSAQLWFYIPVRVLPRPIRV